MPADFETREEKATEWLNPENWPAPQWYTPKKAKKIHTYEAYFALRLRTRYMELENDFRAVLGNFPEGADVITAGRIVELLRSAREALEQETPDLLMVSSALDLVERYMVWLYPPWMGRARIHNLLLKLESMSFKGKTMLVDQLTTLSESEKEQYGGQLRSVSDEAISTINSQVIQDQISRGLQIERLKALRLWGGILLVVFLAGSPLAANASGMGLPAQALAGEYVLIAAWMNALSMALLGAVGGFLSGLLQARSSRVTLTEYLESMLKLQLRPLVGALVSLVLYVFLSWQVLPGITIQNAGTYFILAFLSGFSERFFLRLLEKTAPTEASEVAEASSLDTRVSDTRNSTETEDRPTHRSEQGR